MNINKRIKQIISDMRDGAVYSPEQYVEAHRVLTGEFAFQSGYFIQLEAEKATEVAKLREKDNIKSDAQAERIWKTTENGKKWIKLEGKLKTIKRLLTSIKLSADIERVNWNNEYNS